ncbi:recombinase family protein [Streptomyces sp. NBRC 110028]|uniref:recombinase family protein n=1 Tax=Streptomyces sp. NBRC 110028 TaxID=1621260 RepID=UPI0006E18FA6|nr:recombinase family protein [Streptomyces sp. NBRC 110028]
MITTPQVGSVGNSRRKSTSENGPADGFRHILIGYARVSTADQYPDHQIDALLRADVDRDYIHVDTASGAKASRPKLDLVMQMLVDARERADRPEAGSPVNNVLTRNI